MEFLIFSLSQNSKYNDMRKIISRDCDFRSNKDEPIGRLVDQFDTDHRNPKFIIMINCGFFYLW